jgi:hypothetical protein
MDEFGGFVAKIMDRRAGTHQSGIRQMLMQFFTSSSSFYKGQAAAAEGAAIIHNPCFSIYGTSTAHDFWPSMSGKGVADGFLPRTLIVTLSGEETINYYPKDIAVPSHLIDECRTVLTDSGRGNLPDSAARPPSKVRTATWGPGGHDAYIRWETLCKQRQRKAEPGIDVLWSRCVEKALRVAHIVAIGVNTSAPVLTEELIDWACRLCELSTRQTIVEVKDRLASTDKQAEYLKVRRMIKDGGKDGVAVRALKKMVNGEFDGARFDAIIKQLTDAGDIEFREYVSPKGGRPGYRYFAV